MGTWTFRDITYSDAGKFFLETKVSINNCYVAGNTIAGHNGEAYPKTAFMPAVYLDYGKDYQPVITMIRQEGMAVYYVIQVAPGKETDAERYIMERVAEELYSSCFHPVRHVRKKFRGVWKDKHEKLMPGYVFIRSENAEELYLALKHIPIMTKILGWHPEYITALTEREAEWLEKLVSAGKEGRITGEVPLSRIEVRENDEVKVLSGPLADMMGMVKRINLHRRIAEVEVEFMGRKTIIHLGIDLMGKK